MTSPSANQSGSLDQRGNSGKVGNTGQIRRTLLHELFAAAGDIHVADTELHITLAPLSSPHRTRAAQAVCAILDAPATVFPGTQLRMRFAVRAAPRIGLAFPGSPPRPSTVSAPASTA
jgi:hypothetical protein